MADSCQLLACEHMKLFENKNNPTEVERIANKLLALKPHLFELLIAEGEKAPALQ